MGYLYIIYPRLPSGELLAIIKYVIFYYQGTLFWSCRYKKQLRQKSMLANLHMMLWMCVCTCVCVRDIRFVDHIFNYCLPVPSEWQLCQHFKPQVDSLWKISACCFEGLLWDLPKWFLYTIQCLHFNLF